MELLAGRRVPDAEGAARRPSIPGSQFLPIIRVVVADSEGVGVIRMLSLRHRAQTSVCCLLESPNGLATFIRGSLSRTAVLVLLLTVTTTIPLRGQEIGIEYGGTWARYKDALEHPRGFGGNLDLPLNPHLALRVGVRHHTETLTVRRSSCAGLVPPDADCSTDTFDGTSHLTSYGLGLAYQFASPTSRFRPELYGLGVAVDVDADFVRRTSGIRIGPVTPDGLSPGIALGGQLNYAVTPLLTLSARTGVVLPRFGACGADDWFAFCENRPLPQGSVGVELHLPALRD